MRDMFGNRDLESELDDLATGERASMELSRRLSPDQLGIPLNPPTDGRIHVNVLKVQHHGALANVETDFVKRDTADHYVFCGNGAHHNPEVEVVEAFANARLEGIDDDGPVGPAAPFKFWFTSSPTTPDSTASKSRQKHMKKVKETVTNLRQGNEARISATFLKNGSFEIAL
ncbi:MAG: hypothetical protein ACREXS_06510 [Gammaproteobacteria bacterium]